MIVDSPGIGETEDLDDMVHQYIANVFAFIYVITVANSDGIVYAVSSLILFNRAGRNLI